MEGCWPTNYAILLDGELWLELDEGETAHLVAEDLVVEQATRHGWRNKGACPATIGFVMLGSSPARSKQRSNQGQTR
jgi:quercetin dioxygenase-like cupin family protein